MMGGGDPLEQRMRDLARIGMTIALIFALLPPAGFVLITVGAVHAEMKVTGRVRADVLAQSIAARPRLWLYETERFEEMLRRMSESGEALELQDGSGRIVATNQVIPRLPVLTVSCPIYASGEQVGHLVIRRSPGDVLAGGVLSLVVGLGLGTGLYLAMRAWPLGTLRRAIARLKAADDSKSLLLSAVGHDLRQPLQSLSLFASVIGAADLPPGPRHASEMLNEALIRLGAQLDEIIEIARIDVGAIDERKGPVPLGPLLADLVAEMAVPAGAKGLRLCHVPTSAVTLSDPVLLLTILRNLVGNAIRYTERGRILLGCRRRGKVWEICVYDTGIGIPADKQSRVFDEFYQVGNPERDRAKGLGLGLSIVIRLSRLLRHPIGLASVPGRGSVFTVRVPAWVQR